MANGKSGDSGATNLGPRSKVLLENTQALIAYWHKLGVNPTPDLVTTSGSGLDPTSPRSTPTPRSHGVKGHWDLAEGARQLIARETNTAQLGFLGSDYIDVLQLNKALATME